MAVAIERCRKLLGPDLHLSDAEVLRLRGQMEVIASHLCERLAREGRHNGHGASTAGLLAEAEREEFEERAAIMEFEGGSDRRTAERRALRLVIGGRSGEEP